MCVWVGRGWGWGVEGVAWPLRGAAFAIAVGADPAPLVCRAARPQPRALAGAARAAAPLAQLCVCRGPHARPVAPPVIPGAPLLLARRRAACCTALHSQGPCGPRLPTACAPPAAAALQGTRRVLVRAALPREFRDASLWGSQPCGAPQPRVLRASRRLVAQLHLGCVWVVRRVRMALARRAPVRPLPLPRLPLPLLLASSDSAPCHRGCGALLPGLRPAAQGGDLFEGPARGACCVCCAVHVCRCPACMGVSREGQLGQARGSRTRPPPMHRRATTGARGSAALTARPRRRWCGSPAAWRRIAR